VVVVPLAPYLTFLLATLRIIVEGFETLGFQEFLASTAVAKGVDFSLVCLPSDSS
jgi:hypothetical protein